MSVYQLNDSSLLLHDLDEMLEIDALVASGDCFELLASRLDQLHDLSGQASDQPELEHIIHLLLDLQRRYTINKKIA